MLIVGTAGHIDHGKTTLIRSLTGIETDRLREEKERGISIELGFAYLDLPDGSRVGLIDVPGHEKFVHHMIAGATGVDLVLLLVAADEGVMPQTREHLAICQLLGMKRGLVVLSKTDLVDPEWLELVSDDLATSLQDTFLAGAPILPFSSTWTGEALDAFRDALFGHITSLAQAVAEEGISRPFMMPVDRVFSIKGFGTIATGTTVSGSLSVGETVEVVNQRRTSKVRRIEIHGEESNSTQAGNRTALNLSELKKTELSRGDVLARPGTMQPVDRLAGMLETVKTLAVPLKRQFKALFHVGSTLAEGTVRLLESTQAGAGEKHLVTIRLETPVVAMPGNRFVLRGFSTLADYGRTMGGGTLLWPRWVKARPHNIEHLRNLTLTGSVEAFQSAVFLAGVNGVDVQELPSLLEPSPLMAQRIQDPSLLPELIHLRDPQPRFIHRDHIDRLEELVLAYVGDYHSAHPRRPGIPKEELRSKLPEHILKEVITSLLGHLAEEGKLRQGEQTLSLPDFSPSFDNRFVTLASTVEERLLRAGLEPPSRDELARETQSTDPQMNEVLVHLAQQGIAVRLKSDLYLHKGSFDEATTKLVNHLKDRESTSTQELKELYGLSRKFLIPLIETFDAHRITLRVGASGRKLRQRPTN